MDPNAAPAPPRRRACTAKHMRGDVKFRMWNVGSMSKPERWVPILSRGMQTVGVLGLCEVGADEGGQRQMSSFAMHDPAVNAHLYHAAFHRRNTGLAVALSRRAPLKRDPNGVPLVREWKQHINAELQLMVLDCTLHETPTRVILSHGIPQSDLKAKRERFAGVERALKGIREVEEKEIQALETEARSLRERGDIAGAAAAEANVLTRYEVRSRRVVVWLSDLNFTTSALDEDGKTGDELFTGRLAYGETNRAWEAARLAADTHGMEDAYRTAHPKQRSYTHGGRRIDRIDVSRSLTAPHEPSMHSPTLAGATHVEREDLEVHIRRGKGWVGHRPHHKAVDAVLRFTADERKKQAWRMRGNEWTTLWGLRRRAWDREAPAEAGGTEEIWQVLHKSTLQALHEFYKQPSAKVHKVYRRVQSLFQTLASDRRTRLSGKTFSEKWVDAGV